MPTDLPFSKLSAPREDVESSTRELTLEELEAPSDPAPLLRLRHTHHQLAWHLAKGATWPEAAAATGHTPARIKVLLADPSFQELVEHYTNRQLALGNDIKTRLEVLSADVLTEIQERLEDTPESFTPTELRKLLGDVLDRTGFGKTQSINTNSQVSIDQIHTIKREVEGRQIGKVTIIDARTALPSSRGVEGGEAGGSPDMVSQGPPKRLTREGEDL